MSDISRILANWSGESAAERNRVFEALYDELRSLAARQMRRGDDRLDVQPTVLVHEAYFKLVGLDRLNIDGRAHFLGLAGRLMREVLIDEIRRGQAQKRRRDLEARLTGDLLGDSVDLDGLLVLDRALTELGEVDPDYQWLADARLFAGLTIEEAASGLGISNATAKRRWRVARAWLAERLQALHTAEQPGSGPVRN